MSGDHHKASTAQALVAPVSSDEPLALERNLALMAGAGAGKTYSLITICLHLLGGARRDGVAVRASELFLLTFTEKAAAEMRQRLRARVDRLARDPDAIKEEVALSASYARHGRTPPPQDFWRRLRDDLGAATIGTFHSLCVQLLRRAPAGFGVDPAFELMEERDAAELLHDIAERVVLEALAAERPGVADLCRDMSFTGQGRTEGLVESLCAVFTKVREEGLRPASLPVSDEPTQRAAFERALEKVKAQLTVAIAADAAGPKKFAEAFSRCARALEGMGYENFLSPGRWPQLKAALVSAPNLSNQREDLKRVKFLALGKDGKRDERIVGLHGHFAACAVTKQEEAFRALVVELQDRHRAELDKRAVLDFSELLIRTRNLLRDVPTVRREVQDRVKALLVDEFQDTNRLQLELVTLLAERREGAPRLVHDGAEESGPDLPGQLGLGLDSRKGGGIRVEDVPLEPGLLAAVGDRKQSIYEFRGADVSVFEVLARQIERDGGGRAFLQDNRRSSPALLAFFNAVFARAMGPRPDPRDYEVAYQPGEDDLRPVRAQKVDPPVVERLIYTPGETAEECRLQDAEALARRLKLLLAPEAPEIAVGDGDVPRRARGGDVAILFRRFTYLETYRQALIRHGVPHRVVRGRGFYGAQEVLDLASLLALVADPQDAISLAAVLRSPLVALSDASLFRLAWSSRQRLVLSELERSEKLEGLAEEERRRLERFVALYPRLRRERDRLGIRVLLQVVLEETGFRVALAGTPFGEQALANVEKLLELAGRRDLGGQGDCAQFARELVALAEAEPNEAQADVLDSGDPRAVQLLTIHRAKGLEWPIVVVPDLSSKKLVRGGRIVFERRRGLAIKPHLPDELEPTHTERYLATAAELSRREEAEATRTLYVALTRARDRLVLSGQTARPQGWRKTLDAIIEDDPRVGQMVKDIFVEQLPEVPSTLPLPSEVPEVSTRRVERALSRARSPLEAAAREVVFPVTQLQDFFLCPRRYLYAHEVGLSEHPMVFELDETPEGEAPQGRSKGDPRLRGTLAHALLERVNLTAVGDGGVALREHLEELLWAQGHSPKDKGNQEILEQVESFLSTRFARHLARAGPARVHRELPFLLRLGQGQGLSLYLKGTIDLLFEDDEGGALVLDYKFSRRHPSGLSPYAFQLDCYALAARQYVREGVPVRTGLAFLRDGKREPEVRPPGALDEAAFAQKLLEGARALLAASHSFEWSGRPPETCAGLRCGYQYRCHPQG